MLSTTKLKAFLKRYLTRKSKTLIEGGWTLPDPAMGCTETGDATKDPRGCWNVRCQLGKRCCRDAPNAYLTRAAQAAAHKFGSAA